jgi:hypothetical protein
MHAVVSLLWSPEDLTENVYLKRYKIATFPGNRTPLLLPGLFRRPSAHAAGADRGRMTQPVSDGT